MPLIRKRRAASRTQISGHTMLSNTFQEVETSPSPPPTRRRRSPSVSEASSNEGGPTYVEGDGEADESRNKDQMVKKLVRLALATEYSRQPLRRADITAKGTLQLHPQLPPSATI